MGWLYESENHTKRDLIQNNTKSWKHQNASGECIAHCIRGTVLWSVWEIYCAPSGHFERYIRCDLTGKMPNGGPWGYKDMDESMHPYQYSCPLSYLKMVPKVLCADWRAGVQEFHAKRNRKVLLGATYDLPHSTLGHITIKCTRPLVGVGSDGRRYHVRKAQLGKVL